MKLDLHTHPLEALGVFGHALPSPEMVRRMVSSVKERGLDGIAITEHSDRQRAFLIRDLVKSSFHDEIVIIPGQELNRPGKHVVELYLPDDCVFRFVAHPGFPSGKWWDEQLDDIHGVEVANGHYLLDEDEVRALAEKHGLLLLCNSDAHRLEEIGLHYNVVEIEELCSRGESRRRQA